MKKTEFARRRRQLMRMMGRGAIAIVPAASVKQRNNDVEYHYRQDSDFQYLTGFGEPETVAVLVPGRPQGEYVLFVRDRDPTREICDGFLSRIGIETTYYDPMLGASIAALIRPNTKAIYMESPGSLTLQKKKAKGRFEFFSEGGLWVVMKK